MARPVIDFDSCNGCGVCIKICPANAIEDNGGLPRIPEDIESKCLGCSACLRRCPLDAIHVLKTDNHKKDKRRSLFHK